MGAEAVIPPRSNRLTPREFDRERYKARNHITALHKNARMAVIKER